MSDWDFLWEMRDRGYSSEEILDAAACGYAPWEYLDDEDLERIFEDDETEDGDYFPKSPELITEKVAVKKEIFEELIGCAKRYFSSTGRYLQIWGELGELYAEIEFGLIRHKKANQEGSDGFIKGQMIEVKTISPEKNSDQVVVKKKGNFQQLLIVKIDKDFSFRGKIIKRKQLSKPSGRIIRTKFK